MDANVTLLYRIRCEAGAESCAKGSLLCHTITLTAAPTMVLQYGNAVVLVQGNLPVPASFGSLGKCGARSSTCTVHQPLHVFDNTMHKTLLSM